MRLGNVDVAMRPIRRDLLETRNLRSLAGEAAGLIHIEIESLSALRDEARAGALDLTGRS